MRWHNETNDYSFNLWHTGAAFFSPCLNIGIYLLSWAWPKVFILPGSTYCLGGTVNWELGPLRVVWVRAYNPTSEVSTHADKGLHHQNHQHS